MSVKGANGVDRFHPEYPGLNTRRVITQRHTQNAFSLQIFPFWFQILLRNISMSLIFNYSIVIQLTACRHTDRKLTHIIFAFASNIFFWFRILRTIGIMGIVPFLLPTICICFIISRHIWCNKYSGSVAHTVHRYIISSFFSSLVSVSLHDYVIK